MSKKIWRGRALFNAARRLWNVEEYHGHENSTIIPDALCHPVKEALELCKAVTRVYLSAQGSAERDYAEELCSAAFRKYTSAVAKMKKKATK